MDVEQIRKLSVDEEKKKILLRGFEQLERAGNRLIRGIEERNPNDIVEGSFMLGTFTYFLINMLFTIGIDVIDLITEVGVYSSERKSEAIEKLKKILK